MIQQKRYIVTFSVILLLGIIVYIFLVPNFETFEFNQEVVDNIADGVTTSIPNNQNIETETETEDNTELPIVLEDEDQTVIQDFLLNSFAKSDINNFETYLLIGSDERNENSSLSRGFVEGARADVILLGLFKKDSDEMYLLSIPRDTLIQNGCTDNIERINASFIKNNCGNKVENLAASISKLTGLKIDHFASFNFEGFEEILNSLNGIEICVDVTQREGYSFELQKGCQLVNGSIALNWIVSRHTEILVGEKKLDENGNDISEWKLMPGVSDLTRNDRQQYVVLQLLNRVKEFRNLTELSKFVTALENSFVIDENLSLNKAANLLWGLKDTDFNNIIKLSMPVKNYTLEDGRQVLIMTENFTDFAITQGLLDS